MRDRSCGSSSTSIQVEELAEKQPYGTGRGSTSFRSEFLTVVLGKIVIGGWHGNILILWMRNSAVHLFLVSPVNTLVAVCREVEC